MQSGRAAHVEEQHPMAAVQDTLPDELDEAEDRLSFVHGIDNQSLRSSE
jgi:hypothetical protein